jgi:hypothetical protein
MQYISVYSILTDSARIPWFHLVIGVLVLPLFIYAIWRQGVRSKLVFAIAGALLWDGIILPCSWSINSEHIEAQNLLRNGECQVVEGPVEQFVPMPYGGHSAESFTVKGVQFQYSDFDDSKPGFNKSESHGGPIHKNMWLRLTYHDSSILQIEVPKDKAAK